MTDAVLRFGCIDDEIRRPKVEKTRLIKRCVKAVANTKWGFKEASLPSKVKAGVAATSWK
jgi:hypothetical protein